MKKLISIFLILALSTPAWAWDISAALQGYWKMNDNAASTTVLDASGNGHNGTFNDASGNPNTSTHSVAGKLNTALTMDDADDYINMGDVCDQGTNNFSVAFWYYSDEPPMGAHIIKKQDASSYGYLIEVLNSLKVKLNMYDNTGSAQYNAQAETVLTSGIFNLVVIVCDRTQTTAKVYIDNVESTVTNTFGTLSGVGNVDNAGNFNIGNAALARRLAGDIDNVQIFNRVLTSDEITALWNSGAGTEATSGGASGTVGNSNILILE